MPACPSSILLSQTLGNAALLAMRFCVDINVFLLHSSWPDTGTCRASGTAADCWALSQRRKMLHSFGYSRHSTMGGFQRSLLPTLARPHAGVWCTGARSAPLRQLTPVRQGNECKRLPHSVYRSHKRGKLTTCYGSIVAAVRLLPQAGRPKQPKLRSKLVCHSRSRASVPSLLSCVYDTCPASLTLMWRLEFYPAIDIKVAGLSDPSTQVSTCCS